MENNPVIVNVGCGMTPTPGALNFDNSFSVRLAARPGLLRLCRRLRLVGKDSLAFAEFCRENGVRPGDCARLPLPDGSADAVYSSHMVEHLSRTQVKRYLLEARRVLKPGGILRTALPDMGLLIQQYLREGDCDRLIEATLLVPDTGSGLLAKLRYLLLGWRGHRWMYDGASFCKLLEECGYRDCRVLSPGETAIPFPGALNLFERAEESAYVEGRKG